MSIDENKPVNTSHEDRIAEIINGFTIPEKLLAETQSQSEIENNTETESEYEIQEISSEMWYEKFDKPDIMDRFKVHMIDSAIVYFIYSAIYYFIIPQTQFNITNFVLLYFFFVYINAAQFVEWIVLFATNGWTLGKFLYKHKVYRKDAKKLTLKDTIVRSLLIKGFCNAASCGIMNIVSIIVAYIKPTSMAIHDIAANTITVDTSKPKTNIEKRVEFK